MDKCSACKSVVEGWSEDSYVNVCLLVLNNITIQMVPGGFEVKVPGKEKCSHLGFLSTRPKFK